MKYIYVLMLLCVNFSVFARENIDNLLDVPFENLDEVVTSVSRKAENSFHAAASIYVITNEDIKFSGATTLPELLRLAPGIQVSRSDSSNWAITSRGFNDGFGNKLLVLIDGRTVYTPLFSGVYWDMQDTYISDIDRIEIIRGPGATLWGANAVNGIINIITKNTKDTIGSEISFTSGNQEKAIIEARKGGVINANQYYRLYSKAFKRNSSTKVSGESGGNDWSGIRGGFRLDSDNNIDNNYTFQGDIYYQDVNLDLSLPINQAPFYNDIEDSIEHIGINLMTKIENKVSDEVKNTYQIYFDHASLHYSLFQMDISTLDVDFQSINNLNDRNELIWGAGYRLIYDNLTGSDLISYKDKNRLTNLYNIFLQNKYEIIPEKLSVTTGSKFEYNDYSGFEVQPSIRGTYVVNDDQALWLSVARAVRTPNRSEHDVSVVVANLEPGLVRWVGNDDYESEEVVTYELGYRNKISNDFSIDSTLFYSDYDNLRTNEFYQNLSLPSDTVVGLLFENGAKANTYGFEISSTWNIRENWQIKSAYSFLKMDVDLKNSSNDNLALQDEGKSPVNQFNIRSNLYLKNNIELSNSLYFVDELESLNIPSYFNFESRVAWKPINSLEFSIVGSNLFDVKHKEFTAPLHGEDNEINRSIYGKVTWRY